jgi:hypothetical protein
MFTSLVVFCIEPVLCYKLFHPFQIICCFDNLRFAILLCIHKNNYESIFNLPE